MTTSPRRTFLQGLLFATVGLFLLARSSIAAESLNIVLIAGVKNDAYDNEPSLKKVQAFLENTYNVKCSWVTPGTDGKSLQNLDALENADAAIMLVRRMTIPADQLAKFRHFTESGKGLVGLRTATHAWNEWPTFDVDVFGAKYGNHFGPAKALAIKEHPVTTRARAYTTTKDMYKYEIVAPDVTVLMEGTNEKGTMPAAWVRQRPNGRVFYLGFGLNEEFDKPEFLQLIADATIWTTQKRMSDYRR